MTALTIAMLIGLLVLSGLVAGLLLCTALRSARTLEQRCAKELRHLMSLLSNRHLIVSHLADSIPASLDGLFEQRRFAKRLSRAEECVQSLDPDHPELAQLQALENNEQSLIELIDDLRDAIEVTESALRIQAVSGCLDGLDKKTCEVRDALSTYNAAAITYSSFLSSSLVARFQKLQSRYEILDLEPPGSSMSGDSGLSSDRVAS